MAPPPLPKNNKKNNDDYSFLKTIRVLPFRELKHALPCYMSILPKKLHQGENRFIHHVTGINGNGNN